MANGLGRALLCGSRGGVAVFVLVPVYPVSISVVAAGGAGTQFEAAGLVWCSSSLRRRRGCVDDVLVVIVMRALGRGDALLVRCYPYSGGEDMR